MARRTRFYYRDPSAPKPTQLRTLTVIALIEGRAGLLFERRADAPVWSLIAGGVHDTETLAEALRREVQEETGLDVSHFEFFGTFSDPTRIVSYPDGNVLRVASFAYVVKVVALDGLRPSAESEELRFVSKEEIPHLEIPATQRPVLERYLSGDSPPYLD